MSDYRSEDPDGGFKKIFVAIAAAHVVLLGGLFLAARFQANQKNETVVWVNPGSFGGDSGTGASQRAPTQEGAGSSTDEPGLQPTPNGESTPTEQEATPELSPQTMETPLPDLPTATPPPPPPPSTELSETIVSNPSATPEDVATPTPRPSIEPTPRPKPKPTATPTPSPARKPSPEPKAKPAPEESPKPKRKDQDEVKEKRKEKEKEKEARADKEKPKSASTPKPTASPAKPANHATPSSSPADGDEEMATAKSGNQKAHGEASALAGSESGGRIAKGQGSGKGNGEAKGAGSGDSGLEGYVGLLANRFQAAWNQPVSEMALGKILAVTVRIRIEPDGAVTDFEIVTGSGNTVVDDSVREAGRRLARLPPPPNGKAFSAPVRFELGN
jgi:TonB family protein